MLGVVWQCRGELGLVKLVRSLLEMSEFVCHLLEHRGIMYGRSNSCASLQEGR